MEILFDNMPNPFTYFIPIFAVLIIGEAYISYREDKDLYNLKDSMASTWVGIGAAVLNTLTKAYQIGLFFLFYKLFEPLRVEYLGYDNLGWAWWVWALCLVGDDFNFYWHHRFCHTVRIFWAAHLVHHSSTKFNLGTAFRNGWTIFLYKPIYWIWMPILGFNPVMIALCMSFSSTTSDSEPNALFYTYLVDIQTLRPVWFADSMIQGVSAGYDTLNNHLARSIFRKLRKDKYIATIRSTTRTTNSSIPN